MLPPVAARRLRSLPLRHIANRSPWAAYGWLRLRGRMRSLALRVTAPVRVIAHGLRGTAARPLRSLA